MDSIRRQAFGMEKTHDPEITKGVERVFKDYGGVIKRLANEDWLDVVRNSKAVTYGDYGASCAFCQLEMPETSGAVVHAKDCPYVRARS